MGMASQTLRIGLKNQAKQLRSKFGLITQLHVNILKNQSMKYCTINTNTSSQCWSTLLNECVFLTHRSSLIAHPLPPSH